MGPRICPLGTAPLNPDGKFPENVISLTVSYYIIHGSKLRGILLWAVLAFFLDTRNITISENQTGCSLFKTIFMN
jgi:hypothetical protein